MAADRSPLVSMPNVVLTPHIGGATWNTEARQVRMAKLSGNRPVHVVNPEVLIMNSVDDLNPVLAAAKDMLRVGAWSRGPPEISQPGARTATWSIRRPRSTTLRCCSTIWCVDAGGAVLHAK